MATADYVDLQRQYGGRFVAHRDGEVVASAESFDDLIDLLERMEADWAELIIEYVESADCIHVY